MKKTYKELVNILKQQDQFTEVNGVPICIKKIPDNNKCGEFDQRVYENVAKQFSEDAPFTFESIKDKDLEDIQFETIRKMMGFENYDVTTTDIQVEHKELDGKHGKIDVQIFHAENKTPDSPCIIYFHGGGFIGGHMKTVSNSCRYLAEQTNGVVISVDYRLAPEHPFPQGLDDCFSVVEWAHHNSESLQCSKERLIVTGDSAGGNLSASCSILDRDLGTNYISFQALIYPSVNMANQVLDNYTWELADYNIINHHNLIEKSMKELDDSLYIVRKAYVQDGHVVTDPLICPLLAEDFTRLPKTLIITGEFDKFRLEDEIYAEKLQQAGIDVEVIRYCGMDHGFIDKIGIYPQTEDCLYEISKRIQEIFARKSVSLK